MEPISLADFRVFLAANRSSAREQERLNKLVSLRIDDQSVRPNPELDPFSSEYVQEVKRIHSLVSSRHDYDASRDELLEMDPVARARKPSIYEGDSHQLGMFLEAFGAIAKALKLRPGQRVIEFGAGDGQIALFLARLGCEVTVIDIEARYLESIKLQAFQQGVRINCLIRDFRNVSDLGKFDGAVFFEAFHHALEHADLLDRIYEFLTPEGRVVLGGEPIMEFGSYYQQTLPGPWGLRMDGLAVSAVMNAGWMELGYREWYLVEAAMRAGFLVDAVTHPTNGLARVHIFSKRPDQVSLSAGYALPVDGDLTQSWWPAEPEGRWFGSAARMPFPKRSIGRRATLKITNFVGEKELRIDFGGEHLCFSVPPGDHLLEFEIQSPTAILRSDLTTNCFPGDSTPRGMFAREVAII